MGSLYLWVLMTIRRPSVDKMIHWRLQTAKAVMRETGHIVLPPHGALTHTDASNTCLSSHLSMSTIDAWTCNNFATSSP